MSIGRRPNKWLVLEMELEVRGGVLLKLNWREKYGQIEADDGQIYTFSFRRKRPARLMRNGFPAFSSRRSQGQGPRLRLRQRVVFELKLGSDGVIRVHKMTTEQDWQAKETAGLPIRREALASARAAQAATTRGCYRRF